MSGRFTPPQITHHFESDYHDTIHPKERACGIWPPGTEALFKEMMQLHDQKVCQPVNTHMLSVQQKWSMLGYLMFLKQKGQDKSRDMSVLMEDSSKSGQTKKKQHHQQSQPNHCYSQVLLKVKNSVR